MSSGPKRLTNGNKQPVPHWLLLLPVIEVQIEERPELLRAAAGRNRGHDHRAQPLLMALHCQTLLIPTPASRQQQQDPLKQQQMLIPTPASRQHHQKTLYNNCSFIPHQETTAKSLYYTTDDDNNNNNNNNNNPARALTYKYL